MWFSPSPAALYQRNVIKPFLGSIIGLRFPRLINLPSPHAHAEARRGLGKIALYDIPSLRTLRTQEREIRGHVAVLEPQVPWTHISATTTIILVKHWKAVPLYIFFHLYCSFFLVQYDFHANIKGDRFALLSVVYYTYPDDSRVHCIEASTDRQTDRQRWKNNHRGQNDPVFHHLHGYRPIHYSTTRNDARSEVEIAFYLIDSSPRTSPRALWLYYDVMYCEWSETK